MADLLRSKVIGIEVRVINRERHNLTSKATRYGTENGVTISDHVILNPNMVEVAFEMTNTNQGAQQARQVAMELVKKRDNREIFILDTEHLRYKNMVIEGINVDHAAPYRGAYKATLRLTQVGIVGVSDLIEAAGGRDQKVLAKDGTNKTAVNLVNGGKTAAILDNTLIGACIDKISTWLERA